MRVHCITHCLVISWLLRLLVITFLSQLAETAALLVVCECGLECPLVPEQLEEEDGVSECERGCAAVECPNRSLL